MPTPRNCTVRWPANRQTGSAMGVLMDRHRFTGEQAFDRLRDLSMRSSVDLLDVAGQIIYTRDAEPSRA
jgi:AmiR/NasT family two-component response regulator